MALNPAHTMPGIGGSPSPSSFLGVFRRPTTTTGWRSWLTTVDHKRIGIMYGATALVFFGFGGLEALLIRAQLAQPEGQVLTPGQYNQAFTMHATTMVFLVVMPLLAAFANYLIPIMIGARDVAFPRLNALSFWIFIVGGLFLYSSFLFGGAPDGGWFAYVPNTGPIYSPGHGMDFWGLGLQITGIASMLGAVNLIVTCLNMRAPGMTLMRMPMFVWMSLVAQFLLLFAMPVITAALFLLMFERVFDANFFNVEAGADPLLWQHIFWIFGHPEVYILILPSFGIISEIIPVFARKPLFGYSFMVASGVAIGFMGWGVWVHHMFVSGVGPVTVAAFSLSTMFIAVPTGVKIFNWLATLWGGKLKFSVPMLFAIGVVSQFTIGGLSGVSHALAAADTQQTDTYYIVAHFHYVLFGGSLFGIFGGLYFWWPKVFGRQLSEKIGKLHFILMMLGVTLAFGPMHILGLQGMIRRSSTYAKGMGWDVMNLISTIGAFTLASAFLVFIYNVVKSWNNVTSDPDPWDARSMEWSVASPTPPHNFDIIPVVTSQDYWWHEKYEEVDHERFVRRDPETFPWNSSVEGKPSGVDPASIHLPSPSYWPLVLALSFPLIAYGLIFTLWLSALGGFLLVAAIFGWALEPSVDPEGGHDPGDGSHADDEGPDGKQVAALVGASEEQE